MEKSGQVPKRTIADGVEMPLLGFGVFRIPAGLQTEEAVGSALELGYRHIDTAQAYGNEAGVGRALRASGLPREQVFVTTKFLPSAKDPVEAAKRSLESLGLERVDLYLIHWPEGGPTWAWPGMQATLGGGLARAIGVSNFNREELAAVIAAADVTPAVNQISLSPFKYRRALLEACEAHGVVPEAYGSLTHGEELSDPVVGEIAQQPRDVEPEFATGKPKFHRPGRARGREHARRRQHQQRRTDCQRRDRQRRDET
jgi:diketogulonate reductase-like aldo/keto reductase